MVSVRDPGVAGNRARLTRYAGGYIGISLIMGNTPKVGAGPATEERYGVAG
jgi:hypothetical protein